MKKFFFLLSFFLLCALAEAQDHISCNGATFGKTQQDFQLLLKGRPTESYLIEHSNKNLYNRYFYKDVPLNTYKCKMFLHCSIKSKIVFETVSWFRVTDMKEELKFFVKFFEEKYGGHIEESQSELGYIDDGMNDGYPDDYGYYNFRVNYDSSSLFYEHHKEMLALKYQIHRKSDNKAIGEIRISAAPLYKSGQHGIIEITYRDYSAAEYAIEEYNRLMNSIL